MGDLINALFITLAKYVIKFGFRNDPRKDFEVIHELGKLWEGNLIFGLGVKVKYPLQWVGYCL